MVLKKGSNSMLTHLVDSGVRCLPHTAVKSVSALARAGMHRWPRSDAVAPCLLPGEACL